MLPLGPDTKRESACLQKKATVLVCSSRLMRHGASASSVSSLIGAAIKCARPQAAHRQAGIKASAFSNTADGCSVNSLEREPLPLKRAQAPGRKAEPAISRPGQGRAGQHVGAAGGPRQAGQGLHPLPWAPDLPHPQFPPFTPCVQSPRVSGCKVVDT